LLHKASQESGEAMVVDASWYFPCCLVGVVPQLQSWLTLYYR
jgi:hypothetical protein